MTRIISTETGSRDVRRELESYNLDATISVSYRVKRVAPTRFRIWATQKLTEFIRKGFLLDDAEQDALGRAWSGLAA